MQVEELSRRIERAEAEVKRLVEAYDMHEHEEHSDAGAEGTQGPNGMEEAREAHYDAYVDDESDDGFSLEDRFRQLEEEVAILVAGLSRYHEIF